MTAPAWQRAAHGFVVASGVLVLAAGVSQLRLEAWPEYGVFVLLALILFLPSVEVLPGIALPIPQLAVTAGFLYIGGLPIVILNFGIVLLVTYAYPHLPDPWQQRIRALGADLGTVRRELVGAHGTPAWHVREGSVAEAAMYALGLAARWFAAAAFAGTAPPITNAVAIAFGELAGNVTWGALSVLPIYPDRPLLPLSLAGRLPPAFSDVRLIIVLALTPFIFLISYGYAAHGLIGAAAWSLSTLGLHVLLKRLHERRLRLEEQNERLAVLNRELEHRERLSAIGKMSSVVSHQTLAQLGVIGLYADLIRNAEAGDDAAAALAQAKQNAAAIEGALRDVNRVLTDLLVFGRDLRLNLYAHPLDRLLNECIEDCRAEAASRGVVLQVECPPSCELRLDKLKIKQALLNVLRNAIEASPRSGTVDVRAYETADAAEIRIADQGSGIAPTNRDSIFSPFFTTKESGSGLGLAIARVFVEAHGGSIELGPTGNGGGAVFVIRLPRAGPT
jgi:signal transduction histidine kinase